MALEEAIKVISSALIKCCKFISYKFHNEKIKYTYSSPKLTIQIKKELTTFDKRPLMSVVIPVFNVDKILLEKAIQSVKQQWYKNWEIIIVDDASTYSETIDYLKTIASSKINVKSLKINAGISNASNEALSLSRGDYIVLMDQDDEITVDAFYEVVKEINQSGADFIYSDDDKLEMDGSYSEPHFKPDFSPELFFSQNYISRLVVIRKTIIDKVGGWSIGAEGAQDYDLYLKVFEKTKKISHIPKVLYHWRKIPSSTVAEFNAKSYTQEAGKRSLESAIQRRGISAEVHNGKYLGTYRVQYKIIDNPLVSIIIPFKDKPELLDMCINSILKKSSYQNYEIIGISNNSKNNETFEMMKTLQQKDDRMTFYEYNIPFNYSKINNYAVKHYAKGEHILLLNNDIEIITPDWIEALLEFSQRKDIGAVGAKLYYPNNTIQHAGVIVGVGGFAAHSHKRFPSDASGYYNRLNLQQNFSAVTAACLMVKKSIFNQLNGLNENNLKIAYNDVDFCLRVQEQGYLNVFTPYCEAYHHESISRGLEDTPEKQKRFALENLYVRERHKYILEKGDPFYNINLTLNHEDFSLK